MNWKAAAAATAALFAVPLGATGLALFVYYYPHVALVTFLTGVFVFFWIVLYNSLL